MKKISLKNVKETLSRKEMKSITGGTEELESGWCACFEYTCARYFGKQARCNGGGCCSNRDIGAGGSW